MVGKGNQVDLSIVVPAYNEEKNIKRGVLDGLLKYLVSQRFKWELILVDDGSNDETYALLSKFSKTNPNIRVLKEPHRGKGGTVIAGVMASKGDIILFSDLDQATPIKEIEKFFPKFQNGYDIVIGSRVGRKGAPFIRKAMAYGFSFLRNLVLKLPFKDTQCGFKAFKKHVAMEIFAKMNEFRERQDKKAGVTPGFDLELLFLAQKKGYQIAEVNVEWRHKATERISPLRDSWQGFKHLIRIKINDIYGKYD